MFEKALIFVSPGRCGTTRISEILQNNLPNEKFSVTHQMVFSRTANVLGNIIYYTGDMQIIKEKFYNHLMSKYADKQYFITSDPLTAMLLPESIVNNDKVCIVQIKRDRDFFSDSFFRLTRKNCNSFIAHNLIPFWQIGLFPFENILNSNIKNKYKKILAIKNDFFYTKYSKNKNFKQIDMQDIFHTSFLSKLIADFFHFEISIDESVLSRKSNSSGC